MMNSIRFLSDRKLLLRQAIAAWLILFLGVLLFATLATLLSLTVTQNRELVVTILMLVVSPILIGTHIWLRNHDYQLVKESAAQSTSPVADSVETRFSPALTSMSLKVQVAAQTRLTLLNVIITTLGKRLGVSEDEVEKTLRAVSMQVVDSIHMYYLSRDEKVLADFIIEIDWLRYRLEMSRGATTIVVDQDTVIPQGIERLIERLGESADEYRKRLGVEKVRVGLVLTPDAATNKDKLKSILDVIGSFIAQTGKWQWAAQPQCSLEHSPKELEELKVKVEVKSSP